MHTVTTTAFMGLSRLACELDMHTTDLIACVGAFALDNEEDLGHYTILIRRGIENYRNASRDTDTLAEVINHKGLQLIADDLSMRPKELLECCGQALSAASDEAFQYVAAVTNNCFNRPED